MTERRPYRHASPQAKAEAVAMAMAVGSSEAAKALNHPRRNIDRWMAKPEALPVIVASREAMAERTWSVFEQAVAVMAERVTSPGTRLHDVARVAEVAATQHQLLVGHSTSNVALAGVGMNESLTLNGRPGLEDELPSADWPRRLAIDRTTRNIWHALDAMPPADYDRFAKAIDDVLASRDLERFLTHITDEAVPVDRHLVQRAVSAIAYITGEDEELDL